jgi:deazaflavin-dependent oxidoreductase (nitroreductase family)
MLADRILEYSGRIVAKGGTGLAVLSRAFRTHVALYRRTRGLIGHRIPGMPPFLLLEHIGAKSGRERVSPLGYMRYGESVILFASNGGGPHNPAWLHNLRAHPDVTIQIGGRRDAVRARVAGPTERAELWPKLLEYHHIFTSYQQRTTREIPLVVLDPCPTVPSPSSP